MILLKNNNLLFAFYNFTLVSGVLDSYNFFNTSFTRLYSQSSKEHTVHARYPNLYAAVLKDRNPIGKHKLNPRWKGTVTILLPESSIIKCECEDFINSKTYMDELYSAMFDHIDFRYWILPDINSKETV